MIQRRVKRVPKYTYSMVKICNETDKIFTRCYCCGEWKPSGVENFRKEASPDRDRDFRPLCKKCANEKLKEYNYNRKKQKELDAMIQISPETVHTEPLISKEETMESKLDKILSYLGLK